MYQNQKANILVLSIVAVLAISLATPVAQADLDIDWIVITSIKEYVDGAAWDVPWAFEMWVDVVSPGSLDHIDVTGSATFTIPKYEGSWDWSSGYYGFLTDLRAAYPLGAYTLNFQNSSDVSLNTVTLDLTGLSEEPSLNPVNFIYPASDGATGIILNPTLTWTVNGGVDGNALMMFLEDVDDEQFYRADPVAITETEWPVGPLIAGREYELEVSVCEVKDLGAGPSWPTDTQGGDTFSYTLMNEYLNEIEFTTVPVPGAVFLGAIGISMVGWLCRHRAQ